MKQKLISLMIITSALAGLLPGAAFAEDEAEFFEPLSEISLSADTLIYTEDFESIPDGEMPLGWKLYRSASEDTAKTIKAEVRNGALELTDNNQSSESYVIFDVPGLQSVNTSGFEMECDITLGNSFGITCANAEDARVGIAYAFDESRIKGAIDNSTGVNIVVGGVPNIASFRTGIYTNKGADTTKQVVLNEKCNQSSLYRAINVTSNVNKINTDGTNRKMKLKIAVTNTNYYSTVYLNGAKVEGSNGARTDPDRASGKVGLYIKDTAVTIDNVKIKANGIGSDTKMYNAYFKTPNGKYIDAESAKDDVGVTEYNSFGKPENDVTADAQIEASEDLDGNITINVSYGDFTKTLTTKVADFDLISVSEAEAVAGGLKLKVSNNSKKSASAVLIACPMKDGVPFGKGVYYKTVTLEAKEQNKEAEFTFEYDGDDTPDSYNMYFIDSFTNGFRAAAPMITINN